MSTLMQNGLGASMSVSGQEEAGRLQSEHAMVCSGRNEELRRLMKWDLGEAQVSWWYRRRYLKAGPTCSKTLDKGLDLSVRQPPHLYFSFNLLNFKCRYLPCALKKVRNDE